MTQLDRIEKKLNWLRWRLRWGEARPLHDRNGTLIGLMPADNGSDPGWPEEEHNEPI